MHRTLSLRSDGDSFTEVAPTGETTVETTRTYLLNAVTKGGDSVAWNRFYRLYARLLRNFLRRMGLTEDETEDVTQEVLVVAHKSLQDGVYDRSRGRFRSWLYGIARRLALATLRARRRRTRIQWVDDSGDQLVERLEDKGDDADRKLWEEEWRYAMLDEGLHYAEQCVGEKAFAAFRLYVIEKQPVDEVARQVGIAPASVYVYKNRVLKAVKRWVSQYDEEDS